MTVTILMLAGGSALATGVVAQDGGSRQSREFVQAAAVSDAFEMAEAQSALAESKNPQVLAYARMMLRDHGQTSRTLSEAAAREGLQPPEPGIGAGLSPFLATLQSQRGDDFDRVYWRQQALAHRAALVTQQLYAKTGDAPVLRRASMEAIPIIQGDLATAERMSATLDK